MLNVTDLNGEEQLGALKLVYLNRLEQNEHLIEYALLNMPKIEFGDDYLIIGTIRYSKSPDTDFQISQENTDDGSFVVYTYPDNIHNLFYTESPQNFKFFITGAQYITRLHYGGPEISFIKCSDYFYFNRCKYPLSLFDNYKDNLLRLMKTWGIKQTVA